MLDYKQYAEKKCWQWLVLNCTIMVDFDLWMKNMIYFICRNNVFYNESLSRTPFLGGQVCFTQPWRVGNWPIFLKAFPLSLPRSPRRRGRGRPRKAAQRPGTCLPVWCGTRVRTFPPDRCSASSGHWDRTRWLGMQSFKRQLRPENWLWAFWKAWRSFGFRTNSRVWLRCPSVVASAGRPRPCGSRFAAGPVAGWVTPTAASLFCWSFTLLEWIFKY